MVSSSAFAYIKTIGISQAVQVFCKLGPENSKKTVFHPLVL